jgi:hypothetical protein
MLHVLCQSLDKDSEDCERDASAAISGHHSIADSPFWTALRTTTILHGSQFYRPGSK